jgi:type II secretory pathway component PulF
LIHLTLTPGQLARRAEFYHQLGQFTTAGIGVIGALNQLERTPPGVSYRAPIRQLLTELSGGYTLTESLQRLGTWLPAFDIALIQAGEQSGRLDACFRVLAKYYSERAQLARQVISDTLYPLFLFHFATFLFPFILLLASGSLTLTKYLCMALGVLLPVYLGAALVIYAAQSRHGESWRRVFETLLHPVPVLGTARRYLALARLAGALEALLNAGVLIVEAWDLAATASGSPALRSAVRAWRPEVEAGRTPGEMVTACRSFPELFANQYMTGEVSGQLDESLRHLHDYYQEEGSRKLRGFARWLPRGFYLCVVLIIAFLIVKVGINYIQMIQQAGGF